MKTCAFSTGNDAYVPKAVVSLLSVRKWHPAIDLFIVGVQFSDEMQRLMAKNGIRPLELNPAGIFDRAWDYPVECYLWFAMPGILHEQGYSKALYVDGDVYCNGPVDAQLARTAVIAGVDGGSISGILQSDIHLLEATVGPLDERRRLQTGVLFIDTAALAEFELLEKAAKLFRCAHECGAPRKGDDSLFALIMGVHPELEVDYLPPEYNYMESSVSRQDTESWRTVNAAMIQAAKFCHFTKKAPKPWDVAAQHPCYTTHYFARKWRLLAIDKLTAEDLERNFQEIYSVLSDDHLRFFFWQSKNVGDLVTPYLLEKTGVPEAYRQIISEAEITQLEAGSENWWARWVGIGRSTTKRALYIVSTGSVVRLCGSHSLVFGSGVRSCDQSTKDAIIRFVRGPLTRDRFLANGTACPPVYGDPGLLMPRFYAPDIEKSDKIAIIPHFTEYAEIAKRYQGDARIIVINMGCGNLEVCIDEIVSCRANVSSSLHGLVFSHAYGIPTRHVIFSDKVFGDGTKFRDHYLSIGMAYRPIDYRGVGQIDVEQLEEDADERLEAFDDRRLLDEMFLDENGLKPSTFYPY